MKLLTSKQIKEWDEFTISHEPVKPIELMERAAKACVVEIKKIISQKPQWQQPVIFCGTGNNGGDGLAIARLLCAENIQVSVYILEAKNKHSEEFEWNLKRLKESGVTPVIISNQKDFPLIPRQTLIIDALYGSGINRPLTSTAAELVNHINQPDGNIIAIDLPSGLKAEVFSKDELAGSTIIKANETLTFQLPKQSFLFAETADFTGNWKILDIGLSKEFESGAETKLHFFTTEDAAKLIKIRKKYSHKGNYGHLITVGGSFGKMGASVLMSRAGLRAGCGLLTAFVPKVGYTILQTALPEAMVQADEELYDIRSFPNVNDYDAVAVGPGIGTGEYTIKSFQAWLHHIQKPCVIDADALNICARLLLEHHESFRFPANSILTPHPKEFDRMAGISRDSFERLEKQIHFSMKYQVVILLKGAHTSISFPNGEVSFNSSGNAAMATAGSGDALTGVIGSLLAQGYDIVSAAKLGVYLHGVAGDLSATHRATIMAGDIIEKLPEALWKLINP